MKMMIKIIHFVKKCKRIYQLVPFKGGVNYGMEISIHFIFFLF